MYVYKHLKYPNLGVYLKHAKTTGRCLAPRCLLLGAANPSLRTGDERAGAEQAGQRRHGRAKLRISSGGLFYFA